MRAAGDPWRHAGLLFGRMFEDWTIERRVFSSSARVFCIASAGCTALNLAALGHDVVAVDVNAAQLEAARARLTGAKAGQGSVDRLLGRARRLSGLVGWSPAIVRRFLLLDDTAEQIAFWHAHLDTRRWRTAIAAALSPAVLRRFYPAPLVDAIPPAFARVIRRRLECGWSTHPNQTNPYAGWLLLGEWPPELEPGPATGTVTFAHADAASYLESCQRDSFDAFSLSNILDGASTQYAARLQAAVQRTARAGAVLVVRSFAEPASTEERAWALRDRALLWGRIQVESL
jgi:S-adenosylmethionine:diacylglycerol 3-amino-3-carboxypropyl transferase